MQLNNNGYGIVRVLSQSNNDYTYVNIFFSLSQIPIKIKWSLHDPITKQLANVENEKIFCTYDIILRFKGSLCLQLSDCVHGLDIEKH